MTDRLRSLLPLALLAAAVLLFFNKMALTNLILARGDTLLYFYPYWQAAADALQAGRVPLWNPDLFMGAPFIANSQTGFFYPLNWPLWLLLPTPYAVSAALLLHLLIAAAGTYLAARRQLSLDRTAAFLSALLFALGGYLTAQVEHVNQLQGLAWLPWFFALWPVHKGQGWRYYLKTAVPLALLFTLQLLAGHTQSLFITAVGFTLFLLTKAFTPSYPITQLPNQPITQSPNYPITSGVLYRQLPNYPITILTSSALNLLPLILGIIFALLLSAVQLLPTLELTQYSSRQGGLPFNEVLSFSLHPLLVARALLPAYGQSLFSEYTAFLPLTALLLALIAAWHWRKTPQIRPFLLLAVLGFFLALGQFNPLYYLLARLPGFNLFRVPARWLVLYGFGLALLAGYGWHLICRQMAGSIKRPLCLGAILLLALMLWAAASVPLAGLIPTGPEAPAEWPNLLISGGWLLELAFAFLLIRSPRLPFNRAIPLLLLTITTLFLASRHQPYNSLTTPEAYTDLQPPITRLQAAAPPTGPKPRFLSLSNIFFDPGDLAELETIYDGILSEEAFYDYTIAIKQKEIIAPNLPLAYGLSSLDGFDGGVLPLQSYTEATTLLLPDGVETTDGRLREHLPQLPEARWLDLFGAQFIITDKVGDTWREVAPGHTAYFDLQHPQLLETNERSAVAHIPAFQATHLFLIASGSPGTVTVTTREGESHTLTPQNAGDDLWSAVLPGEAAELETIELTSSASPWNLSALTLFNSADRTFQPLTLGRYRLIHSGDVKIYENLDVLPRAFMVYEWLYRPTVSGSIAAMNSAAFNPAQQAVIVADGPERVLGQGEGQVEIQTYQPERIELTVDTTESGLLLLTEANYPGWQAAIDGQQAEIQQANGLFQGVVVPSGQHTVTFTFQSRSYQLGRTLSLISLLALTLLFLLLSLTQNRKIH